MVINLRNNLTHKIMKTLKIMLAGIALLFASVAANATVKLHPNPITQTDVVNMYINAVTTGNTDNLDKILDNDLQFNTARGANVNTLNKDQLVDFIKANTVTGLAVTTDTTVLTSDNGTLKVKVDFKYDGYTRTDVLSLVKTNGWKVTSVDSSTK
jgi:hypothetical protein